MNINMIIANNIQQIMKEKNIKQVELAQKINVSKQIMSKMLNGGRIINAVELSLISKALSVNMEQLMGITKPINQSDVIMAFMGEVNTLEAKEGLENLNKIVDMIIFHKKTLENGKNLMRKLED